MMIGGKYIRWTIDETTAITNYFSGYVTDDGLPGQLLVIV